MAASSPDAQAAAESAKAHNFHMFFFDLPEGVVGTLSLLVAVLLSHAHKTYTKNAAKLLGVRLSDKHPNATDIGVVQGAKRLHALSVFAGAILALPFALLGLLLTDVPAPTRGLENESVFSYAFSLISIILFTIVLRFYADSLGARVERGLLARVDFSFSILAAALVDTHRGDGRLTMVTAISAAAVFVGKHASSGACFGVLLTLVGATLYRSPLHSSRCPAGPFVAALRPKGREEEPDSTFSVATHLQAYHG